MACAVGPSNIACSDNNVVGRKDIVEMEVWNTCYKLYRFIFKLKDEQFFF